MSGRSVTPPTRGPHSIGYQHHHVQDAHAPGTKAAVRRTARQPRLARRGRTWALKYRRPRRHESTTSHRLRSSRSSLFDDTALQTSITRAATQQRSVSVRAANRPLWFPGAAPPSYLDGSVAGDRGFDPIGLGAEPRAMAWYRAAELVHARWAMLGVAGILAQEITHPEQWWYVVNASLSLCRETRALTPLCGMLFPFPGTPRDSRRTCPPLRSGAR